GPAGAAAHGRGVDAADAQLLAGDPDLLQVFEHLARHPLGQVHEAVVLADVDAADVAAFQVGLVGDRADDIGRLHAVHVADLDPERLHREPGRGVRARLA